MATRKAKESVGRTEKRMLRWIGGIKFKGEKTERIKALYAIYEY